MSANIDTVALLYASRNSDIYSALSEAQSSKEYVDSVSTIASMGSLALSFFSFGASVAADIAIQSISDYYKYAALAKAKSNSTVSMEDSYNVGEPGSETSAIANSILNEGSINALSSRIYTLRAESSDSTTTNEDDTSDSLDVDSLSNYILTK